MRCRSQVFLKPEEKYEHLQTYICEQTSVVAESQILLYRDKLLLSEIGDNTTGTRFNYFFNYFLIHYNGD